MLTHIISWNLSLESFPFASLASYAPPSLNITCNHKVKHHVEVCLGPMGGGGANFKRGWRGNERKRSQS